jgi:hypothetical protein
MWFCRKATAGMLIARGAGQTAHRQVSPVSGGVLPTRPASWKLGMHIGFADMY